MRIKTILTIVLIIIVNICIIGLFIGTFQKSDSRVVDSGKPIDVAAKDYQEANVTYVYEQGMDTSIPFEIKEAISYFTPELLKNFNDDGWKIMIVSNIDFKNSQYEGTSPDKPELTVGFTNMNTKIIQIKDMKTEGFVKLHLIHEMCHYADVYYKNASSSEKFVQLFNTLGSQYVEFEYAGMTKTEENATDIEYTSFDNLEFFACSMKDYLINPNYIKENYKALWEYYQTLIGKYIDD